MRIGQYLPMDKEQAFLLYTAAHEDGNPKGTYYVGRSYLEGCGVDIDTAAALPYLYDACRQGVGNAACRIAQFYEQGIGGFPHDFDSALYYYIQGANGGSAEANNWIGQQLVEEEAYENAVGYLYAAGKDGHPEAAVTLALLMQQGLGFKVPDPESAYNILTNVVSRANSAKGYCHLGIACLQGNGCPADPTRGKLYLDTAASLGSVLAMYDLGICHANGYGCAVDTTEAIHWFEQAADNGRIDACNQLGDIYEAQGAFRNAALYYEKAVIAGDLEGYCNLGYCYQEGQGVVLNSAKALELYRVAADHGYVRGYMCVANCYMNGIGVEENYGEAYNWLVKAAEAGSPQAMYYCGSLLADGGEGLKADPKAAKAWYKKAAAAGFAPAAAALSRMK